MAEVTTVLIAEDNQSVRLLFRRIIQDQTRCSVVGEALDGLQAVRLSEELQPNLVLLDVSMPNLNGLEACRGIRRVSPQSKIVFLSQDPSPEIVEAAFESGGTGYLLKADAVELPLAINSVLDGAQFISRHIKR